MKQGLIVALLCGVCVAVNAEPVAVRVKVDGLVMMSGTFQQRGSGFVVFQSEQSASPGSLTENRMSDIEFKIDGLGAIQRQFEAGVYGPAADAYARSLSPALPYIDLPSNLTPEFLRWMLASYWSGDYDKTLELSRGLRRIGVASLQDSAFFYERLVRLEQGAYDEMAAFLETPEAATVYPDASAVRRYIEARLLQHQKKPLEAIRTISKLITGPTREPDWMPRAELLCAELYFELDMPEAAHVVLADVRRFYSSDDIQKKAAALAAKQK